MKRQALHLINKKASERQILISTVLLATLAQTAITLPVNAQGYNPDSYLPPEIIPVNQTMAYGSQSTYNSPTPIANQASVNAPMSAPVQTLAQTMQTPQEARQAIYNQLMGNNVYPQFNGQSNGQGSYNELTNNINNLPNQNFAQNPVQNFNQTTSQNNQMNTLANNYEHDSAPTQTQVLSGNVVTQNTSQQRTTGGISHLAGVISGFGMSAVALAGMRSPGGIYSAGLLGTGMMNYGLRNGFRF